MDAQTRSALKKDDVFIHSTQAGLFAVLIAVLINDAAIRSG